MTVPIGADHNRPRWAFDSEAEMAEMIPAGTLRVELVVGGDGYYLGELPDFAELDAELLQNAADGLARLASRDLEYIARHYSGELAKQMALPDVERLRAEHPGDSPMAIVGRRMGELRRDAGMSVADVSAAAGVDRRTVVRWEAGGLYFNRHVPELNRLAARLGADGGAIMWAAFDAVKADAA